jgi:hypothetical protein
MDTYGIDLFLFGVCLGKLLVIIDFIKSFYENRVVVLGECDFNFSFLLFIECL